MTHEVGRPRSLSAITGLEPAMTRAGDRSRVKEPAPVGPQLWAASLVSDRGWRDGQPGSMSVS
jgi:hypothetical protein